MRKSSDAFRRLGLASALLLGFGAAILALVGSAGADDTDLVRENTAKPFVFFLLDTSSSMSLELGTGLPLPLSGDDPRSRIFRVKEKLYLVLADEVDIAFGMATYNQNTLRVWSKHWLYKADDEVPSVPPLLWPAALTGYPSPSSDQLNFGRLFVEPVLDSAGRLIGALIPGGTCAAPLSFDTLQGRQMVNRYAKLGEPGLEQTTEIWITSAGITYRMRVSFVNPLGFDRLGNSRITVDFNLKQKPAAVSCSTFEESDLIDLGTRRVQLKRISEFLMHDQPASADKKAEATGGDWSWQDMFAESTNGPLDATGNVQPFSGKGIEGNYDSDFTTPEFIITEPNRDGATEADFDPFCVGARFNRACANLQYSSSLHPSLPSKRELDRGDLLPWDWERDNKQSFLERLAPSISIGAAADFRAAPYFRDNSDLTLQTLRLKPEFLGHPPIVAFGQSPLARAVNDFRCWYNGTLNDTKCSGDTRPWDEGWRFVAEGNDPLARCRRPFLIVISDGEDTTPPGQENASADVGNLFQQSGDPGVQTWVINVGDTANCQGNGELNSIANQGKPPASTVENCLSVATGDQLETALRKVIGLIKEEARSFASAAVPSVQADEGDKIFLTQFTPENDNPVWEGHIFGFLKPLPLSPPPESKPLLSKVCDATVRSNCFLWDSAEVIKTQVNAADPLGPNANQRRVYYSRATHDNGSLVGSGEWATSRRLFDPTVKSGTSASELELDLWGGLGVPFTPGDEASEDGARIVANNVIANTFTLKSRVTALGGTIDYILGEAFHSNPLVVGPPANTRFFAENFNGYRDFAREHLRRRRILVVGLNDGMLHAFDTGTFDPTLNGGEGGFTDGTGTELFGYIPRGVMPTVNIISKPLTPHQWSVDGTVNVADAYIDVVHNGTPVDSDREWRTVLVAGLRRGGESYYALDITQPDELTQDAFGNFVPKTPAAVIPTCLDPGSGTATGACHNQVGYPAPLWNFDDSVVLASGSVVRLDEDGDTFADLAQTWSVPNLGRIRVVEGLTTVDKFVAIFGGGLDPNEPTRGQWLYMVDIETGKTLYKQPLVGAAPAEPAAVDTDQDGLIDRIYIGTTAGFMYRVDLTETLADGTIRLPETDLVSVSMPGVPQQNRILVNPGDPVGGIDPDPWFPRKIFTTAAPISSLDPTIVSRPIFFRPSVIFVASLGEYALAFGTGDRENLWSLSNDREGRFYVFVDQTHSIADPSLLPLDETDLQRITDADGPTSANFLIGGGPGTPGWFLVLQPRERLVTNPFALSGILFFSTFNPVIDTTGVDADGNPVCALQGGSRVFGVFSTNGNGLLVKDAATSRWINANNLVTEPFVELGQTQNPDNPDAPARSDLTAALQKVMEGLMKLFPSNCRFANYRIDVKTITADTGVIHVAPVPVCIIEKNWKEF